MAKEQEEHGFFRPMKSNRLIENFEPRHAHNASKGAFSDEARDALAVAVSKGHPTVRMDQHMMDLKYYPTYIYAVSRSEGKLPSGTFDRELLASRLEDIV